MNKQLPLITGNRHIECQTKPLTNLIGRGLSAIQNQKAEISNTELDTRYRKARDNYDRITDFDRERCFKIEAMPENTLIFDTSEVNPLQQLEPFFTLIQQLVEVSKVFKQLSDAGYGKAYLPLSNMYWGGQGISQDADKGKYYFRLAFDWCFANQTLTDPEIWRDLGQMLYRNCGTSTPLNDEQSLILYRKAAEYGDAEAQCHLGWIYSVGRGVKSDENMSNFWYQKSAEQGHFFAHSMLGDLQRDYAQYMQFKDIELALYWLHIAAEKGYARAQCELGEIYLHTLKDYKESVFWFRKSAQQGKERAQFELGRMYANGLGVEQDYKQAIFWYRQVADYSAATQFSLAEMYQNGCDIEQDYDQAVLWYRKSAENGYGKAQNLLGSMYENGIGVDQDKENAAFWYKKAFLSSDKKARWKAQKALENLELNGNINNAP